MIIKAKLIGGPKGNGLVLLANPEKFVKFPVHNAMTAQRAALLTSGLPASPERDEYLHLGPASAGGYEIYMYVGRRR